MMRKVCPCNGCGITSMCVSHDNMRFYCNRCLPYYVRGNWYWEDNQPVVSEPKETTTASTKTTKTTSKKKG